MIRIRYEKIPEILIVINNNKFKIYRKNTRIKEGIIQFKNGHHCKTKISDENFHLVLYKKFLWENEAVSIYKSGKLIFSTNTKEEDNWIKKSVQYKRREKKNSKIDYVDIAFDVGVTTIIDKAIDNIIS